MKKRLRLVLIRHGMTRSNREKRYIGKRSQEPLLPESRERLAACARSYPSAMRLFSSPSLRAMATAKILYPRLYRRITVIDELDEMDFGVFEGKNFHDLEDDTEYREWVEGGCKDQIRNGESREAFCVRTLKGMERVIGLIEGETVEGGSYCLSELSKISLSERPQEMFDAAVVAHGGTIMAFLSERAGGDFYSYQAACGEGYSFTVEVKL